MTPYLLRHATLPTLDSTSALALALLSYMCPRTLPFLETYGLYLETTKSLFYVRQFMSKLKNQYLLSAVIARAALIVTCVEYDQIR